MLSKRSTLRTLLLALTAFAALTSSASAGSSQDSILQDDRLLSDPARQADALNDIDSLGVGTVHAVVLWTRIEGTSESTTTKPAGFDGSDPAAYPVENWDTIDDLVRGARARDLDILLSPAAFGPSWASNCPSRYITSDTPRRVCMQDPEEFGAFVEAIAKRYSGTYSDENQGGGTLPKVTRWSISNEPNQASWIAPQRTTRKGVPVSPRLYREQAYAAIDALRANGHSTSDVYLGETAPRGGSSRRFFNSPTGAVTFYRGLFCVDAKGRRLRGKSARRLGCSSIKRFDIEGIAHHPYTRGGFAPLLSKSAKDQISIGDFAKLQRIIRFGQRRGVLPRSLPVHYTEFAVSSRPPARSGAGVPLSRQAEWLNWADYLAYLQPVRSVAQFQLEDDSALLSRTFQTGLRFADGRAKPSYAAYKTPLYLRRRGGRMHVFGGARGQSGQTLELRRGSTRVATVRTNSAGWFLRSLRYRQGTYQLAWTDENGNQVLSRRAKVRKR